MTSLTSSAKEMTLAPSTPGSEPAERRRPSWRRCWPTTSLLPPCVPHRAGELLTVRSATDALKLARTPCVTCVTEERR